MSKLPIHQEPSRQINDKEPIRMDPPPKGGYRGIAVFLICCGILIAAFAMSAVWQSAGGERWFGKKDPAATTSATANGTLQGGNPSTTTVSTGNEASEDGIPIVDRDLSYLSLGEEYIHNETPYTPDVNALVETPLERVPIGSAPLVLILHTHTSEGYLNERLEMIQGLPGDVTYSEDPENGVVSVGKILCDTLKKNGIGAIHCTDRQDLPTLRGSYERAAETVKRYLLQYPSIQYVIDLHRDSILTSDGAYVRSMSMGEDPVAQVMAVVGTDVNGTQHSGWEENLALALQLRSMLNEDGSHLCRPVSLRNASFNQELAPYSLLLEIGTGANTLSEAEAAARRVGEALATLIKNGNG